MLVKQFLNVAMVTSVWYPSHRAGATTRLLALVIAIKRLRVQLCVVIFAARQEGGHSPIQALLY